MDLLQNIEFMVSTTYKQSDEDFIKDVEVIKAYDLLILFYRKKVSGQEATLPEMEEAVEMLVDNIQGILAKRIEIQEAMSEKPARRRFSRRAFNKSETEEEKILAGLRRLKKSATMWNKEKGKYGYLDFISRFV